MKTTTLHFGIALFIIMGLFSCSSKCERFYTYNSKEVDIKGLTSTLKKAGVEVVNGGVAEININPEYVVATEFLQRLDLLQFSLCSSIKDLPKNSPERIKANQDRIKTLNTMFGVTQKIQENKKDISSQDTVSIDIESLLSINKAYISAIKVSNLLYELQVNDAKPDDSKYLQLINNVLIIEAFYRKTSNCDIGFVLKDFIKYYISINENKNNKEIQDILIEYKKLLQIIISKCKNE